MEPALRGEEAAVPFARERGNVTRRQSGPQSAGATQQNRAIQQRRAARQPATHAMGCAEPTPELPGPAGVRTGLECVARFCICATGA
jgi:hypothetical protein